MGEKIAKWLRQHALTLLENVEHYYQAGCLINILQVMINLYSFTCVASIYLISLIILLFVLAIGHIAKKTVCFYFNGKCCYDKVTIQVKNCGEYFVYRLPSTSHLLQSRYCTTKIGKATKNFVHLILNTVK